MKKKSRGTDMPQKDFDYTSTRWQRTRAAVLRRDNYQCQGCRRYGRIRSAVIVHHIKHADECPELAYTGSNLISLCAACHNKAHPEKAKGMNRGKRYGK